MGKISRAQMLFYNGIKSIALLLSLVLLHLNFIFANSGDEETIRGILRYKLDSVDNLRLVEMTDKGIIESDTVYNVYVNNSYSKLWNENKINDLVRAIIDIKKDGLNPEDYHLEYIIKYLSKKDHITNSYPEAIADMDIILTDALSMLMSHVKYGKVDSRSLNYGWDVSDNLGGSNLSYVISEALKTDSLYDYIESYKPKLNYYKNLKRALNRIQFHLNRGGWEPVPYGEVLKKGMSDERIILVRNRLIATNHLTDLNNLISDYYDENLVEAVKKFQIYHNLNPDGVIGPNTLKQLNISAEARVNQIKVNLERARWVSGFNNYRNVIVNIAGFKAYYTDNGKVVWSSRIQVGKPYRKTPIFKSEIKYLVFNPSWSVPPVIMKNDILPAVKRNPSYLAARGFDVYNYKGDKVSPYNINWSNYSTNVPYTIRQKPGIRNALGRVKFIFPNNFSVYLHDTPNKHLFDRDIKTFSSGCIRIENPFELAELLLNDKSKWNSESMNRLISTRRTRTIYLDEPVQIMIMYWTASADSKGNIYFMEDVYNRDKELLKYLMN